MPATWSSWSGCGAGCAGSRARGGLLGTLFLAAGIANAAVILVSRGLYLAVLQYGSSGNPEVSTLLSVTIVSDWMATAALPMALLGNLAIAGAVLTTGALPRWLGWLAAATGVLTLLSLAWMIQTAAEGVLSIAPSIGFWLSVAGFVATSVLLFARSGGQPQAARV